MIEETLAVSLATFTLYHTLCIARVISSENQHRQGKRVKVLASGNVCRVQISNTNLFRRLQLTSKKATTE